MYVARDGEGLKDRLGGRPSVPPMVSHASERVLAPGAGGAPAEPVSPVLLFNGLRQVIEEAFEDDIRENGEFFRVKYYIATPRHLVRTFGRYAPVYNEPIRKVRWEDLFEAIVGAPRTIGGGPRGVHFVHDPVHRLEGGAYVMPVGTTPPFSLDASLDGRGSIAEPTPEVELWWSFAIQHLGEELAGPLLEYACGLVRTFGRAVSRLGALVGHADAAGSLGREFFCFPDEPSCHGVDPGSVAFLHQVRR